MSKFKKIVALMFLVIMCIASINTVFASGTTNGATTALAKNAKSTVGWNNVGTNAWRYFKDDGAGNLVALSGWQTIGNKTYYFHPHNNVAATGWTTVGGRRYYFHNAGLAGNCGEMITGWRNIGKKRYYFNPSGAHGVKGAIHTGWLRIGEKTYYLNPSGTITSTSRGELRTGWRNINGKRYNFKNNGEMNRGWRKISGKHYYFKPDGGNGSRGQMLKGLRKIGKKTYFLNNKGVRQNNRWVKVKGSWYHFNKSGVAATKWKYVKGLRYYFESNGKLSQDVRNRVKGPYRATINRRTNVVTIYARHGARGYTIPVKAFTCSVGRADAQTPTGTFNTTAKYRWKSLMGPTWGQYATRIVGGILFHSVSGPRQSIYSLPAAQYNRLGNPASAGCVRLNVRDAKWIYDNCQSGMQVTISDTAAQPFDKPKTIKIPANQNWDPTDPAVPASQR